MATKKAAGTKDDTTTGKESVFEILNRRFKDTVRRGDNIPVIEHRQTGIAGLDVILGGGLPAGRHVELFGVESVGKSSISLQICRNEIALGGEPVILDYEETISRSDNLYDGEYRKLTISDLLADLNLTDKLTIAYPTYGEDGVDVIIAAAEAGSKVIVVDSLPFMMPKTTMDKLNLDSEYHAPAMAQAAMFTRLMNALKNGISHTDACVIWINQGRDKVNSPHGGTQSMGGHAMKHLFSARLFISHATIEKNMEGTIRSHVKCLKNKTASAYDETDIPISCGIVQLGWSLIIEAQKVGIVDKAGSWFKLNEEYATEISYGGSLNIGQGESTAGANLEANQELYKLVYRDVLKRNGIA